MDSPVNMLADIIMYNGRTHMMATAEIKRLFCIESSDWLQIILCNDRRDERICVFDEQS